MLTQQQHHQPRLCFIGKRIGPDDLLTFTELGRVYSIEPRCGTDALHAYYLPPFSAGVLIGYGSRADCLTAIFANAAIHS